MNLQTALRLRKPQDILLTIVVRASTVKGKIVSYELFS
jgi:hypothetical protein